MSETRRLASAWHVSRLCALVAIVGLSTYAAIGPPGSVPRPSLPEFPKPRSEVGENGAATAHVDPLRWLEACRAARLPELSDPSRLPFEPVRRLVQAARGWTHDQDGDALGRMAEIYLALDRPETAIDLLAAARELGQERARWNYLLGVECQRVGQTEAAIEIFEQSRRAGFGGGLVDARLGALLLEAGQLDAADERFRAATQQPECSWIGHTGRARVALERADFEGALAHSDRALAIAPLDYLAHRQRAKALAGLDRIEEARLAAERSSELPLYSGWVSFDPWIQEAHEAASSQSSLEMAFAAALRASDLKSAAKAGEELLARVPQSTSVLSSLASVYANLGRVGRAAQLIETATQLEPRNSAVLRTRAEIGIAARRPGIAVAAAETLIELDRNAAVGWALLGRARLAEGKPQESLDALREAVRCAPRDAEMRILLAEILFELERVDEALIYLREVLATYPDHPEALRLEARWTSR